MIHEIIFYGRGGQGAVTAANILVEAAMYEGLNGQAFPFFGAERRGAPVTAFARVSDKPILKHGMFNTADILVVFDQGLVASGVVSRVRLRNNGVLIVNTPERGLDLSRVASEGGFKAYAVDATRIAHDLKLVIAGWPVVNTAMLGALVGAVKLVGIESVKKAIVNYFGEKAGAVNAQAAERAYAEVKLVKEV
ncbi:2-oxoacid:acceptor oxidoreductase family protein [Thermosphaera aggregans]|jgi:pyruvate ferredoxin oxidoreductase gamma subunit|uniref:pyruvate synthase n=1 Tax=Thermosphaera aggregans (strain DSM 11486 / M11TL) TaxID=633148 RepID=D5U1V2_THEAM|nr:2-oxoacid:acceptor oxidoreductase family protein [Thermosphaera aggregans]ADG91102.1 pyruvate/ketoisovalerate oxidoreductase, gamma subunit [Thermosphaera aggregans DSM 11486]MCC5990802.1 2-oxoacid:acceptor oxidoreductase family protein [Thermosphaera sp.]